LVGKRGSKYYEPPRGNIKYNWSTMTGTDKEKLIKEVKERNLRTKKFGGLTQM